MTYDVTWHVYPSRSDRKVKEITMQLEEEKASSQRFQDNVTQLNNKIRTLRREKDEAEGETEGVTKKLKAARSQIEELEEGNSDLQTQINRLKSSVRKARVSIL